MSNKTAAPTLPAPGDMIACAFCRGTGKDPFGLLSERSKCQVCVGTGTVVVRQPRLRCVFCGGSGVYPDSRLTCTVCGGKGANTAEGLSEPCPICRGTGKADVSLGHQPCAACRGMGFVAPRREPVALAVEARRHPERAAAGVGKEGGARRRTAASPKAKLKAKGAVRKGTPT